MCGRFTLKSNPHKFAEILGVTFGLGEWLPIFNIAPTQTVLCIRDKDQREFFQPKWGLNAGEFDFLQVLIARRTFFDANVKFVAGQMILAKASVLVDGQLLSVASTVLATRNSTAACVIRRSTGHSKSIANSMHDLRLNRQILQVRQI